MHILISRTDSIGDVVLTIPVAGLIKKQYPNARISFIGRSYTEPVIRLSQHIDEFINYDLFENHKLTDRIKFLQDLKADWIIHVFPQKKLCRDAKKAGIKNRVGTSHRTYHWTTCNRLVSFTRKNSDLHESQLNCKLLSPLNIAVPELDKIREFYGFKKPDHNRIKMENLLDKKRKNIVLHPKSKGHGREWGLPNFEALIHKLPQQRYKIFISGTRAEGDQMKDLLERNREHVTDLTGTFNLDEYITFLSLADAIVASGTGPLHIAAALGTLAIGLFPPIRPIHPGRWAPVGEIVEVLVKQVPECNECRKTLDCKCIRDISPNQVLEILNRRLKGKN